jgi:hypothetical protein
MEIMLALVQVLKLEELFGLGVLEVTGNWDLIPAGGILTTETHHQLR